MWINTIEDVDEQREDMYQQREDIDQHRRMWISTERMWINIGGYGSTERGNRST